MRSPLTRYRLLTGLVAGLNLAAVTGTVLAGDGLPASVSNVEVRSDGSQRGRWLEFDSALLGLRAVTHVTLPVGYGKDDQPFGALYWLHGTRATAPEDVTARALEDPSDLPALGFGLAEPKAQDDDESENFLFVYLDAGSEGWCNSCWWVDGRNGYGVLAESHLHQELIPVVEALFNVRSDRGGRAVAGSSMGGIGALIQAFRHPDRFGYVASQSGPESAHEHNEVLQNHQDGLYYGTYMIGQGYPNSVTHPIAYRNIDVVTLAPQMIGTDVEILLWAGDGCLPPYESDPLTIGDQSCLQPVTGPPDSAFHMVNEWGIRTDNEVMANRLIDLGVPFRLETGHGRHAVSDMYAKHAIPDFNRVLRRPRVDPRVFSYKTTDRAFSVWGYDVAVLERPNEEFLHLLGAQRDGLLFTVAGTGSARVTTPLVAPPGTPVDITIIRENAEPESHTALADGACRVTLELDLGDTHAFDQRRSLSQQGLYMFPRTRVELAPEATLPAPERARPHGCR